MDLIELVKFYYEKRGLKWPDIWEALAWQQTEIAEVYELLFDRSGGWVRNNPEDKPKFSKEELAKELGDAIFMLLVAGIVEGVNPLQAMEDKMKTKLEKLGITTEQELPFTKEIADRNAKKYAEDKAVSWSAKVDPNIKVRFIDTWKEKDLPQYDWTKPDIT
jgi:NTP pyrophosphatase (non-canonical NTP hydrolase)